MVEVLVALAVFIIVLSPIYSRFHDASRLGRMRFKAIQARWLAHQEFEQLRACSYNELKSWQPPAEPSSLASDVKFDYRHSVRQRQDGLLELRVEVAWNLARGGEIDPAHSIAIEGLKGP